MTKVALIGAGRWGKNISKTLANIPDCEVVAVATSDAQTKALLKQELDAIVVATPGSTHASIALPFLNRGLPVFIEKPMALSVPEAENLKITAQENNTHVFVGHIHLYNPAFIALKRELKKIGPIKYIIGESMSDGPVRDDMSVLWDWGPHDVSLVLDILSSSPARVQAIGHSMHMHTELTFPGRQLAYLTTSWLSPVKRKNLTVVGSKGTLIFDDYAAKKVKLIKNGRESYPRYGSQSPLEVELLAFLKTAQQNLEPITNADNGLEVVRVLAAAEQNLKLG